MLQECSTIRDLGVIFDSKLTFIPHIDNIVMKASKMLGFLIRNAKQFKKPYTKIKIYNSYVRSILEYCSVVWSPNYAVHQLRIERIQKRFCRHLSYSSHLLKKLPHYDDKLKHFKMVSLKVRRQQLDMSFLFKIIRSVIDCPILLKSIGIRVPYRLPRRPLGVFAPAPSRTNLKYNSVLARLQKSYNDISLSSTVDVFHDSLHKFKSSMLTE